MNPILTIVLIWVLLDVGITASCWFLNSWKADAWHYNEIARDILGMPPHE